MKTKIFNVKSIVALALALFMVMPMLLIIVPVTHASSTDPYISIVPTGSAGVTSQNNLPAVAVGNTFEVDVRIDNTASVSAGINGYSYKLTWDPTVLSCIEFDDPASNVTAFLHLPTPAHGASITSIPQQNANNAVANDIIVPSTSSGGNLSLSCGGSGVLSQIEFQVLTTGQSALTLSESAPGTAVLTSPDGAGGSNPVNYNLVNAVYNQQVVATPTPSPTPTPPPTQNSDSINISCYANPHFLNSNSTITLTANVNGNNPMGTVTWQTNSSTGTFGTSQPLTNGLTSVTYTDTQPGNVLINATYNGDTNNTPTSSTITLTLYNLNFTRGSTIGFQDTVYFVKNYISSFQTHTFDPACDLNHDGTVNFSDLIVYVAAYVTYAQQTT